jgi:hypothetical protein
MVDSKGGPTVDGASDAAPNREPYVKPAVAWEEHLETRPGLLAGCTKVSGQSFECDSNIAS